MGLFNRKKNKHQDDKEANAEVKLQKVDKYANGEEYDLILRYVNDSANDTKSNESSSGNIDPDSPEAKGYTRTWYGKKVPFKPKSKVIPQEWLKTDLKNGLNDSEIEKRRKDFGFNELSSPNENQFLNFLSYFKGPILYVMEAAVILAAGLQDWIDFGVIIAILFFNALVGYYQEKSASDIVAKLKEGIAMKALVVRNGKEIEIEARDLVIGDIVILEEGTVIPADAKIICDYDQRNQFDTRGTGNSRSSLSKTKSNLSQVPTQRRVQPPSTNANDTFDQPPSTSINSPDHPDQIDNNGLATRAEDIAHPNDSGSGSSTAGSTIEQEKSPQVHSQSQQHHFTNAGTEGDEDEDDKAERKRGNPIISVDQSAITGESLSVEKYVNEVAYYTCGVNRGKAIGVVSVSAKESFVGKTAGLVLGSNEKGHFQIILGEIGTTLLVLAVVFILIVWIGGFFRGIAISEPKQNNLLVYALIFLIISVPIGLPVVTTTTLGVGAAYLAKRKCIVQKLSAIESLAGADILCTDKTGTLTANKLSLNEPYLADGVDANWFMTVAALASSHKIKALDPIDRITILSLKDYPGAQENLRSGWKTINFAPFDPVSKRIEAIVEKNGKRYTCCKGAPNSILKLRTFDPEVVQHYRNQAQIFAKKGFRSLDVAIKEDGKDWDLLGIMSMSDPPRYDTAATVAEAQSLKIKIIMLTGDAVAIAKELAKQLHSAKIWIMSTVIGLFLAGGTCITRGTMFLHNGGIIQNFGSVQEVLFLEVALTESFLIFITRSTQNSSEDSVLPSIQLVAAVIGVDILASLFVLFGWLSGSGYPDPDYRSGRTSIVTVVRVWLLSIGITVIIAGVYMLLNKITWLDNLGKKNRSHKNTKLENFVAEMAKMTLIHEQDETSHHDFYRFSSPGDKKKSEDDEEDKSGNKKDEGKVDKSGKNGKDEKKKE